MRVAQQHGGFLPVPQTRGPWRIAIESVRGEDCTVLRYDDVKVWTPESAVWMDDSEQSLREHQALLDAVTGSLKKNVVVATTGLGIGFAMQLLVKTERCSQLIVVEKDPDIVSMVWPHVSKLSSIIDLVFDDANTYLPPVGTDVYFFDHTKDPASPEVRKAEAKRLSGRVDKLVFWDHV